MILFDLISEQTITQPPTKLPAAGGVPVSPTVNTSGDAAKTVIAQPQPAPSTAKPQPTGPAAAQQAATAQPAPAGQQPANATQTSMEQSQADLEERVMKRMQELAGMLRR
jgi:hypothetical protein